MQIVFLHRKSVAMKLVRILHNLRGSPRRPLRLNTSENYTIFGNGTTPKAQHQQKLVFPADILTKN